MNKLLELSYKYLLCPIAALLKKRGKVFIDEETYLKSSYWVKSDSKKNFKSIF